MSSLVYFNAFPCVCFFFLSRVHAFVSNERCVDEFLSKSENLIDLLSKQPMAKLRIKDASANRIYTSVDCNISYIH